MVKNCEDITYFRDTGQPHKGYYLDGYLKDNIDNFMVKAVESKFDCVVCISGSEGCLTGDTLINTNRATMGRRYTLKRLYQQYHQMTEKCKNKNFNLKIPTFVRSYDGKTIRLHTIKDVVYHGKKEVFKLELENGYNIKATKDHKIMTQNGWVEVKDLTKNDEIMCDTLRPQRGEKKSFKLKAAWITVINHPYPSKVTGKYKEIEAHRLIYEASINQLDFMEYLDIIWNDAFAASKLKFVNPELYHIHHKNGNHYDNSVDNLELLDKIEHKILHAKRDEGFRNFNQGIPTFSKVKLINSIGIEDTYDIICEEPYHNFVANGMVVHNSGKTTIATTIAHYVDPTFPGEPLNDETPRRHCDRIVFDHDQIMEAIDNAKPKQAIVIDEAVLSMFSQDFSGELQKVLIKKFVTIRKKRLFIFVVIPSIFMLRKYFAIFRTRACVHCRVDEGVKRGMFNFYSYNTKRQLWIRGIKEFDQSIVQPDFSGAFTDTNGFFFDPEEYDQKKEAAIKNLTQEPTKEEKIGIKKDNYYIIISKIYDEWCISTGKTQQNEFLFEFNRKYGTHYDASWLSQKLGMVKRMKGMEEKKDG